MLINRPRSHGRSYASLSLPLLLFLRINLDQGVGNSQFLYFPSLNDKICHEHSFFISSILTPDMMAPRRLIPAFSCAVYDRSMSLTVTYHLIQDATLDYICNNGCSSVLVWRNCSANEKGALHADISHSGNVGRLMLVHCFTLAEGTAGSRVNTRSLSPLACSPVDRPASVHLDDILVLPSHVHIQRKRHLNVYSRRLG